MVQIEALLTSIFIYSNTGEHGGGGGGAEKEKQIF